MTTDNSNGWDDEVQAIKKPYLFRCQGCGGAFFRPQVKMLLVINYDNLGNPYEEGIFYCYQCLKDLKPEGCPLVAYDDPAQYEYLCLNCPIPDLMCDLRFHAPLKVVKKK